MKKENFIFQWSNTYVRLVYYLYNESFVSLKKKSLDPQLSQFSHQTSLQSAEREFVNEIIYAVMFAQVF